MWHSSIWLDATKLSPATSSPFPASGCVRKTSPCRSQCGKRTRWTAWNDLSQQFGQGSLLLGRLEAWDSQKSEAQRRNFSQVQFCGWKKVDSWPPRFHPQVLLIPRGDGSCQGCFEGVLLASIFAWKNRWTSMNIDAMTQMTRRRFRPPKGLSCRIQLFKCKRG